MSHVIANCASRGLTSFDLGAGRAEFKAHFCSGAESRFDCYLAQSLRGCGLAAAMRTASALKRALKAKAGPDECHRGGSAPHASVTFCQRVSSRSADRRPRAANCRMARMRTPGAVMMADHAIEMVQLKWCTRNGALGMEL
jgi:CelD/BcsL family acetyltransferase involved in cellulose biosynthesis